MFTCAAPLAAEPEPTAEGAAAAGATPAAGDAKQPEMIKEKKTDDAPKAEEKKGGDKKK